jgi:2-haloacid dehalogenase
MIEPLVKNRGMEQTFDAVLSVDALKTYKPAPQVYRLAVERLGVAASDIGFVSSNGWDAAGAKSFGFTVYWINRLDAPVERLGFTPDAVLKGLGDLPRIIST